MARRRRLAVSRALSNRTGRTRTGLRAGASYVSPRTAATRRKSKISLEAEDVVGLGLLHAGLVMLLPDLPPGPAVHVRHLVLDGRARRDRRRAAVDRVELRQAFDERERIAGLDAAQALKVAHDAHGLNESLGVVEDTLVVQADDVAGGVAIRRVDLDRLQRVRELGIAVRLPALDVRCPRDQRVAVPEADRLAEPARHVGAEPRRRAAR